MVANLALGMVPAPFDVNLFAACTVARISLDKIISHLPLFVAVIIGGLMLFTCIPSICLALRDAVNPPAVVAPAAPAPAVGPQ